MRKKCAGLRCVFPTVVCCLLLLASAMAVPFKTSEEKIPRRVKAIIKKQTKAFFGKQDFAGVPLLDPKIDWNIFSNWPDEFTFRGKTNYLQITDWSHGDFLFSLKSRAEVKPGMSILASYSTKDSSNMANLKPSGYWLENGCIEEKVLMFNWKTVFGYHCDTSGRITRFSKQDYKTKEYCLEYYDRNGNITEYETHQGKP